MDRVHLAGQGATVRSMGCFRRTMLVCAVLVCTPVASQGQVRGGGVAVPGSSAGPGRSGRGGPAPVPGSATPAPYFVLWFGYLGFYPSWIEDWPAVAQAEGAVAQPLASPPDGVPTGGLQLDVEPRRAKVYVDGFYAGVVGDFSGYYHHLDVTAGPHQVDILLDGYQPQTLTIVVPPGRTTTHRGTLEWTTKGN
jgi:PEGA domain